MMVTFQLNKDICNVSYVFTKLHVGPERAIHGSSTDLRPSPKVAEFLFQEKKT